MKVNESTLPATVLRQYLAVVGDFCTEILAQGDDPVLMHSTRYSFLESEGWGTKAESPPWRAFSPRVSRAM